jgi:hypothetical protein
MPLREALSEAAFVTARDGAPLEEVREQLAREERGQARMGEFDKNPQSLDPGSL